MIRGTTPTHTFNLPIDPRQAKEIRIIYAQNDEVVLVKTMKDLKLEDSSVSFRLTQEETLLFDSRQIAKVQLRVLTAGGDALASDEMRLSVRALLEDEVME